MSPKEPLGLEDTLTTAWAEKSTYRWTKSETKSLKQRLKTCSVAPMEVWDASTSFLEAADSLLKQEAK